MTIEEFKQLKPGDQILHFRKGLTFEVTCKPLYYQGYWYVHTKGLFLGGADNGTLGSPNAHLYWFVNTSHEDLYGSGDDSYEY
jgi:hypothetical protein